MPLLCELTEPCHPTVYSSSGPRPPHPVPAAEAVAKWPLLPHVYDIPVEVTPTVQEDSRDHPILPHPFRWELVEFVYRKCPEDWQRSYVDLVLQREGVTKRIRFFGPQELEISTGLPNSQGLQILDVSNRQLDGIKIRVSSFEPAWGVPTFWAQSVIEVDC